MPHVQRSPSRLDPTGAALGRPPAFLLPALALLTVLFTALGSGAVLVSPSLGGSGGLQPAIGVDPVPAAGAAIEWSAGATEATTAQERGLRKLVVTTLGFTGLTGLVALLGLLGLWHEESLTRRAELAIRRAVGASRRRLRTEVVVETLILAAVATGLGVVLTTGVHGLIGESWPGPLHASVPRGLPLAVAGILLAGCLPPLLRGLAFSVGTAAGTVLDAETPLAEAMERAGTHSLLSVVQVALVAAVLTAGVEVLVAAGSTAASPGIAEGAGPYSSTGAPPARPGDLRRLEVSRPGVDQGRSVDGSGLPELLQRLRAIPSVRLAAFASPGAPLALGATDLVLAQCGNCFAGGLPLPIKGQRTVHHFATADTFRALGLRLLRGRAFRTTDDAGGEPVAIVSRSFARANFEDGNPLGRDIRIGASLERWHTVVGVVEDATRWAVGAREQPEGEVYLSALQHDVSRGELLVAGPLESGALASLARERGWEVRDGGTVARSRKNHRAQLAWFAGAWTLLSAVALLVAVFGVFSTIRLRTRQEWREVGIRRAVGARRAQILRRYLAAALKLAAPGLVAGLWLSLFALPYLPSLPTPDGHLAALLLGGVVAPLLLAAVAGALFPAWRAARAAPHEAMEGWG